MGPPTTQPTEAEAQAVVQHEQLKMAQAPLDSRDQTQGAELSQLFLGSTMRM